MKSVLRLKESHTARRALLAAAVLAAAAAVAGEAGIAAGQGNATSARKAGSLSHRSKTAKFKHPRLNHGVLTIKGSKAGDEIALRLQAGQPGILQVDVGDDGSADFSFDRAAIESIAVDGRAGDDSIRIDDSNGVFTDGIATMLDGGDGNDDLAGGSGAETLRGGDGNDSIDGNRGNDVALMGAGDDTFTWDPGDGSDTVEGQDGVDTMLFNGANIAEKVDLSANGNRLRFFRDIAGITMDTDGVEQVDFNALGGADLVTVNDLTGTDVKNVNVDLAATGGGGDGQTDHVAVDGTGGNDAITVSGDGAGVTVSGTAAEVAIQHQEPTDELAVDAESGDDSISATALAAQSIVLTLDGDVGNDTIAGGPGQETLRGGDGNDSIDGNGGVDSAFMGAGDDLFVWDPGDASDIVEGEDGADTMLFNGANVAEQVDLSANGSRLRFFRNPGNIVMDTNGVETVDFTALGGADTINVNDLTGTDVTTVGTDLAAAGGGGDGQPDHVTVAGTGGPDGIFLLGGAGTANVGGLAATLKVTNAEPAGDALTVNAAAGADRVDASGLAATAVELEINGGDDADQLAGSAGGDLVNGGRGADLALLGAGADTFVWNPGDGSDTVEGQDGIDTMIFNGANIAEKVELSANGNRLRFVRDVATVTMDTAGVERVVFNALGGIDLVTVNDLTGTGVTNVVVDLGTGGGGDGAADDVVVKGTEGNDAIQVIGDAAGVKVGGLATTVEVLHPEFANDRLDIDTRAGTDAVNSAGLAAGVILLFVDGVLVP
jgi:Ca2+-binding RTX toxin-like protein